MAFFSRKALSVTNKEGFCMERSKERGKKARKRMLKGSANGENLDNTDAKILRELLLDARQSYHDIAKKVGVSAVTVMKRVRNLERTGIIKKYTVMLDCEKIGYDLGAVINLRISKGKLFMVERKIAADPHVTAVYDNTGDFDATVIAKFKNRRGL
ncbi:Lrp/AsnC family transcriptional regulator, partial [Candidatus Woesearchaeota archaeon]